MLRVRDLFGHLGWKLAAVALAYLFWLATVEERQAIRQLDVPVRFENLNPDVALVRDRPTTLIVRLQGSEPAVKALEPLDVEAHVDLSAVGVGTHLLRFTPDSPYLIVKRPGLKVSEVYPPALEVRLEPRVTSAVTVTAVITGKPAPGFEVTERRVEPPRVRIEGPESAIRETTAARTREVSIEGRKATLQQEVWVDVVNPAVAILGEPRVRVTIGIREAVAEKTFAGIPVVPLGSPFESRITPKQVRVTVRGPEALVAQLTREDVVVYVDLKGLTPQALDYQLPVRCVFTRDVLREKVEVAVVSDEKVGVRVLNRRVPAAAGTNHGG
jgi:YbbR domain-containing protein